MLDARKMVAEARALVGFEDFGEGDVEFHLGRLVDAVNNETRLSDRGEWRFHVAGVFLLGNRLLLNQLLHAHPELTQAEIGPSIMIVGLPRTGSTKLQRLIAQDPRLDHMTLLDNALPLAFPGERGSERRARWLGAVGRELGQPDLTAAHELSAAEPEEELELQKSHFTARNMRDHAAIPKWVEQMKTVDRASRYQLARQYLAGHKLQSGKSGMAWIFKNAYAGEDIDIIAAVFPQAKFVFTHRDPVEQFGSITALGHKWRQFHSDSVTKAQTGAEYLDFWGDFSQRSVAACRLVPADRIIHVPYRRVCSEPLQVVREIYDFCGYELTPEASNRITAYDARNAQHKHGHHEYALSEFDITPDQVVVAYADYIAEFGPML